MTEIKCPYCGVVSEKKMSYSEFTAFETSGKGGYSIDKDGDMRPAKSEGVTDCAACGKKFMFKFDVAVVCRTALYPFEEVK